jgi:ankyrin repeat protein
MVVERLLAHGAKAADYRVGDDGATLLHIAVAKASKCIVRTLIRIGDIPVDIIDLNHNTPLMCACRTNHASEATLECIRLLIELGADINKQDGNTTNTALHTAARDSRRVQILKLLLAYPQTDVNVKNAADQSALKLACKAKNLTAVKLLLECGASLTKQERDGISNECKDIFSAYEGECQGFD